MAFLEGESPKQKSVMEEYSVSAFVDYYKRSITHYKNNPARFKNEILSGLTVAIAQVPESVAFSFVAGVDPIVGLYATFFLGLITAQIGGRPGMVSGAAGAMAVVIKEVMEPSGLYSEQKLIDKGLISTGVGKAPLAEQADDQRLEYLLAVVMLVGILQTLCGVFNLSCYVRLIPVPVMTGFVNGLATVIFMAQLQSFQIDDDPAMFREYDVDGSGVINATEVSVTFGAVFSDLSTDQLKDEVDGILAETDANGDGVVDFKEFKQDYDHRIHDGHDEITRWLTLDEGELWMMAIMISMTMFITHFMPRLTKVVPSSLVGIIVSTIFEHGINRPLIGYDTRVVKDMAPVAGGLPKFHIPDIPWKINTLGEIMPLSISLCLVGLIESVLTLQLVDEILADRSDSTGRCRQECIAQGVANFMSGIFTSMGGDAMIGQSTINVKSGGIGRLSTTFAALMFWMFILVASAVIELVPVSALVGVLFMVVIYTFDWTSLDLMAGEKYLNWLYTDKPDDRFYYVRNKLAPKFPAGRCPRQDAFLIVLVTVVTVLTNLAYAVIAGVIAACVFYSWSQSEALRVTSTGGPSPVDGVLRGNPEPPTASSKDAIPPPCPKSDAWSTGHLPPTHTLTNGAAGTGEVRDGGAGEKGDEAPGVPPKTYFVQGPIFFASFRSLKNMFEVQSDPNVVLVDISNAVIHDLSALSTLASLGEMYREKEKMMLLTGITDAHRPMLDMFGERLGVEIVDASDPEAVKRAQGSGKVLVDADVSVTVGAEATDVPMVPVKVSEV